MKISLVLLALVAGRIAAKIDDTNTRKSSRELAGLDYELEDFLIEDGDDEEDDFDEEEEDEDQSSLVKSLTFLQGRAGVCAGKAKGSCNKQGGECVTAPFADNCKAIHGDAGKLKKQACKSKNCQCCVPPTTGGTGSNKDTTPKPATLPTAPPATTPPPPPTTTAPPPPTTAAPPPPTTTAPPPPTTTAPPPPTTTAQPPPTTIAPPPPTTTAPPPPTTTAPPPPTTTAPPPPTTTAPPPPSTTAPPPRTTTVPPPPTTTAPPPTTTLPNEPPTTSPKTTTPPPPPTTTPPPPPTTTPPPPPTTTPPPPPTTTPPPPPTTTPPPPPTTAPPPPPTTTPPPPPTTTPPPPPTTTPPPPPTTTPPAPTTRAVPEDNLLPTITIKEENLSWSGGWFSVPEDNLLPTITIGEENLSWSCGWFCNREVTYTLVLARGYGNEEEFIYIQKGKFDEGYTLDKLINVCDLQYGTYEMTSGRKGVFMVYHNNSLKPYQTRFDLHEDGITHDILNIIGYDGASVDSENFPGTSTSSTFWDFSWLTGNYLKNVDC